MPTSPKLILRDKAYGTVLLSINDVGAVAGYNTDPIPFHNGRH
jgi:hypothetical protein